MPGWISLHRSIWENWVWNDKPFSKGQAWIDILLMVNYEKGKAYFRDAVYDIERGQKITSEIKLADRWGWSRTKVRRFLNDLEMEQMLSVKRDNRKTVIEVVNYSKYQDTNTTENTSENTTDDTTDVQQKNINNNINKNNKLNKYKNITIADTFPEIIVQKEVEEENIFITLPLVDKTEHLILKTDIVTWKELYPAVNIEQEFRNMKGWLISNPTKRKTAKGIKRFINGWLSREQDKGGNKNNGLRNTANSRSESESEIYDYDKFFD